MHRLRGVASDVREEHTPDGVLFEARLPAAEAGRYARYRVSRANDFLREEKELGRQQAVAGLDDDEADGNDELVSGGDGRPASDDMGADRDAGH
jgi:hypothetical protein